MNTLDRLQAVVEAATPGPWRQQRYFPLHIVPDGDQDKNAGASADPREDRERFAHPGVTADLYRHRVPALSKEAAERMQEAVG